MWRQVQVREICIKCIKYIFQNADYRAGLQDDGKRKIRKHPNLASKKKYYFRLFRLGNNGFLSQKKVLINNMEK